jgi:hypothetical protein
VLGRLNPLNYDSTKPIFAHIDPVDRGDAPPSPTSFSVEDSKEMKYDDLIL